MPELSLPTLLADDVVLSVATTRPLLVNRDPGPSEPGVPIDSPLALEIIDPGPAGIDRTATQVWVDGVLAFDGSAVPELAPALSGPTSQVSQTPDTIRIVLHPQLPFASQAEVLIRVASALLGGGPSLDETYSFTVEDRTAPKVLAAQAIGQRTLRIAFDEPVQVTDPLGFTIAPLDLPAVPISPSSRSAEAAGTLVVLHLDTEMTPDVRYRISVTGVTDPSGNPPLPPHDAAIFRGFRPQRPRERRFDLWSMLPRHNRRSDDTGDLRRFIACLQEVTDLLLAEVDRFPDLFDLERATAPLLDLILADLGNPFRLDLDVSARRRLASVLVEMYRQKGTAPGLRNAIRFFLGLEVAVLPFASDTLVLGESELGVDWILGPSDRFARYAFNLRSEVTLTPTQRRHIRAYVDQAKVAHTHFVDIICATSFQPVDHWDLGVSSLGETTILH
jgi:phage tail-like protein